MGAFTWSSLKWFQSVALQTEKLTYFHKNDFRIASDCIDFDLEGAVFFCSDQFPCRVCVRVCDCVFTLACVLACIMYVCFIHF